MPENVSLVRIGANTADEYAGVTEEEFVANLQTSTNVPECNSEASSHVTSSPRPGPSAMTLRRRKKWKTSKVKGFCDHFQHQ